MSREPVSNRPQSHHSFQGLKGFFHHIFVKIRLDHLGGRQRTGGKDKRQSIPARFLDRKSTRLNSSHGYISYAVFCLKKKKEYMRMPRIQLCPTSLTASF